MARDKNKLFQDAILPLPTVVQLIAPTGKTQITCHRKREPNTGSFKKGNKAAEKWTENTVLPVLQKMYNALSLDNITGQPADNPVRANNIKFQQEICLVCGISGFIYTDWKNKFSKKNIVNKTNQVTEPNKHYSVAVSTLITKIDEICECRLLYSGMVMDMFILKAHYGYVDRRDITSNVKKVKASQTGIIAPFVQIKEKP